MSQTNNILNMYTERLNDIERLLFWYDDGASEHTLIVQELKREQHKLLEEIKKYEKI